METKTLSPQNIHFILQNVSEVTHRQQRLNSKVAI